MDSLSKLVIRLFAFAWLLLGVSAFGQNATIALKASSNSSLLLASRSSHVNLLLDSADWPGVLRAAHDVAVDFGRVTGLNGSVIARGNGTTNGTAKANTIFNVTGIAKDWSVGGKKNGTSGGTIIAGTIGNSSIVDALIKDGKVDVSEIEGKWEAFISVVVEKPTADVEQALVIVGKLQFFIGTLRTLEQN